MTQLARPHLIFIIALVWGVTEWSAPNASAASGPSALELFERERQELLAEQRALETELSRLRAAQKRAQTSADRAIQVQRERWAQLVANNAALEDEAKRLAAPNDPPPAPPAPDWTSLANRAHTTLRLHGGVIEPSTDSSETLRRAFQTALALLQAHSRIEVVEQVWFSAQGERREGPVLRVGAVAALAAGPDGGILAPADAGGALRVLDVPGQVAEPAQREAQRAVQAALQGSLDLWAPIFVFEPFDWHPVPSLHAPHSAHTARRGAREIIEDAGPLGWPIVGLGAFALLIALERLLFLIAFMWSRRRGEQALDRALNGGRLPALEDALPQLRGAWAALTKAALRAAGLPDAAQSELLSSALDSHADRLQRGMPLLKVVAATAPLLGLLGTVMGMIETFDVLTQHGSGDARLLSGGISQALLTTELGLVVAVPVLLVHSLLSSWADRAAAALETRSVELLVFLHVARLPEPEPIPAAPVVLGVAPSRAAAGGSR